MERFGLLLLLLAIATSAAVEKAPEERVMDWIRANGGEVHFKIGKECPTCVRGALATRALAKGELIAKVPLNVSVLLRPGAHYAQERAFDLLERMHTDPSFNKTYQPWWDSQPLPDEVLSPELLSEQHLALLQSTWLEKYAASMRGLAEDYYYGRQGKGELNQLIAPAHISLDTFMYVTALVVTRAFFFYFDIGGQQVTKEFMLPAIDQLNHPFIPSGPGNAWRTNDNEFVYEYATDDIKEGEQITHPYDATLTHRPDMSFGVYGFVARNDPPLLCAQDLPGFSADDPFKATPQADKESDPQGSEAVREEVQRLQKILEGLPTTMEEDQRLMQDAKDWKAHTILELRVERKRALRHRISHLQRSLAEL